MNIKLVISYDGKPFYGWQKTPEGPSVEETLQDVLEQLLQHPVQLQAASRTDRGVHARGQVVNFFTDQTIEDLVYRLNRLLPDSICIQSMDVMDDGFHPTLDNQGKVYSYTIQSTVPDPLERHRIWHFPYPLNLELMQKAAQQAEGNHDFRAFTNVSPSMPENTVCKMDHISIEPGVRIEIQGNRFLYKMVRNLCGTLAYIGCGKLPPNALEKLLTSGKRVDAGITAPAHALILERVVYS